MAAKGQKCVWAATSHQEEFPPLTNENPASNTQAGGAPDQQRCLVDAASDYGRAAGPGLAARMRALAPKGRIRGNLGSECAGRRWELPAAPESSSTVKTGERDGRCAPAGHARDRGMHPDAMGAGKSSANIPGPAERMEDGVRNDKTSALLTAELGGAQDVRARQEVRQGTLAAKETTERKQKEEQAAAAEAHCRKEEKALKTARKKASKEATARKKAEKEETKKMEERERLKKEECESESEEEMLADDEAMKMLQQRKLREKAKKILDEMKDTLRHFVCPNTSCRVLISHVQTWTAAKEEDGSNSAEVPMGEGGKSEGGDGGAAAKEERVMSVEEAGVSSAMANESGKGYEVHTGFNTFLPAGYKMEVPNPQVPEHCPACGSKLPPEMFACCHKEDEITSDLERALGQDGLRVFLPKNAEAVLHGVRGHKEQRIYGKGAGEERDRKPQVNGKGGDETIQIKVKMGG